VFLRVPVDANAERMTPFGAVASVRIHRPRLSAADTEWLSGPTGAIRAKVNELISDESEFKGSYTLSFS